MSEPATAASNGWIDLSDIPRRPRCQDNVRSQIQDMWLLANHFGLRDAADWLVGLETWPAGHGQ